MNRQSRRAYMLSLATTARNSVHGWAKIPRTEREFTQSMLVRGRRVELVRRFAPLNYCGSNRWIWGAFIYVNGECVHGVETTDRAFTMRLIRDAVQDFPRTLQRAGVAPEVV